MCAKLKDLLCRCYYLDDYWHRVHCVLILFSFVAEFFHHVLYFRMDGKHANGVLSVEICQCADLIEFELSDCLVLLSVREMLFSSGLMSLQPCRVLRCLELGAPTFHIVVFMRTCVRLCMLSNYAGQCFCGACSHRLCKNASCPCFHDPLRARQITVVELILCMNILLVRVSYQAT